METELSVIEEPPAEPVLMTTEQVMERMQIAVTRQTVRNWVNKGIFPRPRTIGGRWYFVESEFNEWWQERMK
jgi:excisionase family DNA binding protein